MSSVSVSTAEKQSSRMSTGASRIRPRPVSLVASGLQRATPLSPTRVSSFSGKSSMVVLNLRSLLQPRFRRGPDLGHRKSGFPLKALQRETDLEAPLRLVIEAAIKDRADIASIYDY